MWKQRGAPEPFLGTQLSQPRCMFTSPEAPALLLHRPLPVCPLMDISWGKYPQFYQNWTLLVLHAAPGWEAQLERVRHRQGFKPLEQMESKVTLITTSAPAYQHTDRHSLLRAGIQHMALWSGRILKLARTSRRSVPFTPQLRNLRPKWLKLGHQIFSL